ncbi:MAG: S-methyl-5'-thioadenosine phosphorylase [Firmicutes bacterium]|nr:S-methyl-5'-thioadenosine phosphorylase [Alicyclobacillaceae bacterium]MCL6496784.1 S-methyl-5'-thioadenosine phosphorylase [Bacillota bacterium]
MAVDASFEKVAIIGGSGVYAIDGLSGWSPKTVTTPYGPVEVAEAVSPEGVPVVFLNRHGPGHRLPPHRVNYRANVWAVRALGCRRVVATGAVGSLQPLLAPGFLVLVDQFLDFTHNRPTTFFEGGEAGVVHADMTEPYCPNLRRRLAEAARQAGLDVVEAGTYVATEGPRFESRAEIEAYRRLGGDVVGMTGLPEVVLARELGLCYATLALVTNLAAGLAGHRLSHDEVLAAMAALGKRLGAMLAEALPALAEPWACACGPAPGPLPAAPGGDDAP